MIQRRSRVGRGRGAVLLADDRVPRTDRGEPLPQRPLDRAVGLGDRGQVRLRLDDEIVRAIAGERDRVGEIGQLERKREVVG